MRTYLWRDGAIRFQSERCGNRLPFGWDIRRGFPTNRLLGVLPDDRYRAPPQK